VHTPLDVLQELDGWNSYEMVQRYAHLAPNDLRNYTNNLDGIVTKPVAFENITKLKTPNLLKSLVAMGGIEPPTSGL
jgi:hypothetical protein